MWLTRPVDTLALRVERSRTVAVDEYRYTMDGTWTGQLFLMRESTPMVAWRSSKTNPTTAWHGRWYPDASNVAMVHFDCKGRDLDYKYARIAGPPGLLQGVDYRGLLIRAELVRTWHL